MAFFKWANHALADCSGEEPLCINMDETSLLLKPVLRAGAIATRAGVDHVSLATKRARCTLLASICTDTAIQPLLPQIILCNERFLGKRTKIPKFPGTLIWVQKSAWASHFTITKYLRLLGSIMKAKVAPRRVLVFLDLAPPHLHSSIAPVARAENMQLLYIPGGLTPWLQPADYGCFNLLKTRLEVFYGEKKSLAAGGEVSPLEWLEVVHRTLKSVLPAVKWRRVFEKVGILCQQKLLSEATLLDFGWQAPPLVPGGPPTHAESQLLFPRRRKFLDVMALVLWRAVRLHKGKVIQTLD